MNEMNDDIPEDDDVFSGLFLFVVCIVAAACYFLLDSRSEKMTQ